MPDFVGDEPRRAKSGNDLPLPRYLRTLFLAEGRVPSNKFSYLSAYAWTYLTGDVVSLQDTGKYAILNPVYFCICRLLLLARYILT